MIGSKTFYTPNLYIEIFYIFITAKGEDLTKITLNESQFRWLQNEDAMANDKLSEGIRKFAADAIKLEEVIRAKLSS